MTAPDAVAAKPMRYIRWFAQIGHQDVPLVGGKNASLGEMVKRLGDAGVRVPNGFAITAEAFGHVLDRAAALPRLHDALDGLVPADLDDLAQRARQARQIVASAPLPDDLVAEITTAYAALCEAYGATLTLAVRSSATAEDLPDASFAGQHDSYLHIGGLAHLLDAVQRCFASLFNDRAIVYRAERGIDHFKVAQSVGVMKMVRSDLAASGVAFTLDTESGFRDVVFVTGAYGLGENVVQGTVDPDEFYVFKPTLRAGHRQVLRRKRGAKEIRMVYADGPRGETTRNLPTAAEERARFCITDDEVLRLADAAVQIEAHYSALAGHPMPMDIEWARDGIDGDLYIVQARPETVASRRHAGQLEEHRLLQPGTVRLRGRAVGGRIASGPARVVADAAGLGAF